MKTLIILAPIDCERKELERNENLIFESEAEIREAIGGGILIYELTDFMDACNNQDISSMEDYWFGYVRLKEE